MSPRGQTNVGRTRSLCVMDAAGVVPAHLAPLETGVQISRSHRKQTPVHEFRLKVEVL